MDKVEKHKLLLANEIGKKYNYRTLYRMRKFYETFSNKKLTASLSKLSCTYYNVRKEYDVSNIKRMRQIYYMIEKGVAMPH